MKVVGYGYGGERERLRFLESLYGKVCGEIVSWRRKSILFGHIKLEISERHPSDA